MPPIRENSKYEEVLLRQQNERLKSQKKQASKEGCLRANSDIDKLLPHSARNSTMLLQSNQRNNPSHLFSPRGSQ